MQRPASINHEVLCRTEIAHPTPDPLGAVLFDMDGTLIDSEKLWEIGLRDLAARYGGRLSDAARLAMVGTNTSQTMQILFDDIGQPWQDPVAAADWLNARMLDLYGDGVDGLWLPGARELLAAVRAAGVPTGLVTSTPRTHTNAALRTIGAHNFDAIVCGDEVARTKPDPLPYLTAAAALGVAPARCVAVEDSPSGVASALAAGCAVVAVPNLVPLHETGALVRASLLEVDLDLLRVVVSTKQAAGHS